MDKDDIKNDITFCYKPEDREECRTCERSRTPSSKYVSMSDFKHKDGVCEHRIPIVHQHLPNEKSRVTP